MLLTAEQHEKIAQACYKAAQDKDFPPSKRLEFRLMAKRGRILVRLAREEEARKAKRESGTAMLHSQS